MVVALTLVLAAMGHPPVADAQARVDGGGAPATEGRATDGPRVEEVSPWVTSEGDYTVRVHLPAGHPAARLEGRVFRRADNGAEVRELEDPAPRYRWATFETSVDAGAGAVTLHVPLGVDDRERVALDAGVYPVLLELFTEDGGTTPSWRAVTYLVRLPDEVVPRPVAIVVPVEAQLHWSAEGGVVTSPADVAAVADLVATLAAVPQVPVSLDLEPGVLTALASSTGGPAVRTALASVAKRNDVLNGPYAHIDEGRWAASELDPLMVQQFAAGESTLTAFLGRAPSGSTWVVEAGDSPAQLQWLAARGVDRFILTPDVPGGGLAGGLVPLTIAGIATPHRGYAAATLDAPLAATDGNPVLQANHLLAALAADTLAGIHEPAVVLAPYPTGGDLATLASFLDGLGTSALLTPTPASDLPASGTNPVEVPAPDQPGGDVRELFADLDQLEGRIVSFGATVGPDDPAVAELRRSLLVAGDNGLDHDERRDYLTQVDAVLDGQFSGVTMADGGALTVTSHRARLPVTIRNGSTRTLDVAVMAESSELTMLGDPVAVRLEPGATEDLEIPFRVSRSGDFAVDVRITSPDGGLVLAAQEVTLRSTAVSGVGIVLSVGALIVLGVWWGRSVHRRRNPPPAPSVAGPAPVAPPARVEQPVP